MTIQEESKIQNEVFTSLSNYLKMEGVDIMSLDSKTRELMIVAFQCGVSYWAKKVSEMVDKTVDEIKF